MSQENVEIVRRGYEHLSRTGEFLWELIDLDVEVHDPPIGPDSRVYLGHEGLRTALANVEESFDELDFEPDDFLDAGSDVVVLVRMRGRGKGSGVAVEAQIAHVWTLRDGKGVRIRVLDRETALEAAGLSEAMSQENLEVVKAFTRRFEGGDRDQWREYFDPNVVLDASATEMPFAGVYHGHQGIERFFRDWLGTWKDYEIAHREYIDAGDAVVVVFRQSGTGRGSGVRTERDFFGVYELRESKVVRYRMYESRQEALEALGLSE